MAKHYLKLTGEIQPRDYDAAIAHSTIVLLRYCFLEYERRIQDDGRSYGELFYQCYDEIRDISFLESLNLLISVVVEELQKMEEFTEKAINSIIEAVSDALKSLYPQLHPQGCRS